MRHSLSRLLLLGACSAPSSAADTHSLARYQRLLAVAGPDSLMSVLSDSLLVWTSVTDSVASGDSGWLALGEAIAPVTDAGGTLELLSAFTSALSRNPTAVLRIVDPARPSPRRSPLSLSSVCHAPDIDVTDSEVAAFRDRTLRALNTVSDTTLTSVRDACRAAIVEDSAAG